MTASKDTKKKRGSGGGAQQFLVWHGEKIAVAAVIVVALWFSMKGMDYAGQTVSWRPSDLEENANEAEQTIRASERKAKDEEIIPFDYAEYAEQIERPISADPYRAGAVWNPVISPGGSQRSSGSSSSY